MMGIEIGPLANYSSLFPTQVRKPVAVGFALLISRHLSPES